VSRGEKSRALLAAHAASLRLVGVKVWKVSFCFMRQK